MSGIDFDEEFICPRAVVLSSEMITDAHFQDAMPTSPNVSLELVPIPTPQI